MKRCPHCNWALDKNEKRCPICKKPVENSKFKSANVIVRK